MKRIFALVYFFPIIALHAQETYPSAYELLQLEEYKAADSVLTNTLTYHQDADTWFNRGVARINLGDTLGYCNDMYMAAHWFMDQEAVEFYNLYCCNWIDTIYYNNRLRETSADRHRFYEVIKQNRYDNKIIGSLYDSKYHLSGTTSGESAPEIIAEYSVYDNRKYYHYLPDPPGFLNTRAQKRLYSHMQALFSEKYSFLKEADPQQEITIEYVMLISDRGEIQSITPGRVTPEIELGELRDQITEDLQIIPSRHSRIWAGRFQKRRVFSVIYGSISF